jgi:glutamate carboxypeptidase
MRRSIATIAAVIVCSAMPPSAMQTTLDPVERAIVEAVAREQPAALALLEEVVNINSGTLNRDGVRRVGDRFRTAFEAIGLRTRWVDGAAFERAGHLVAEHDGPGPHVLLIGHLDTVFERDDPFQRFERISPTEARGPGIIDMKGGDVIIVQALSALRAAGVLDRLHVSVILTGDEEDTGTPRDEARRALYELADAADIAIGFENGSGDPRRAITARRGFTGWTLKTTGRPAHSSQIFREDVGSGAIFELARVLEAFRTRLAGDPLLTFNPGLVAGGSSAALDGEGTRGSAAGKTNVVAGEAFATGDLRAISPEQLQSAKAAMSEIAAAHLPQTSSVLTFDDSYPPMAPTAGNARLLEMYDRVSRDLGTGPVQATDPRSAGAADISFTAGRVAMALDAIGLMGRDDHTAGETADLRTLPTQTSRAALLLYRLASGSAAIRDHITHAEDAD